MPRLINRFRDEFDWLSNGFVEPDGTCVEVEYQEAKFPDPLDQTFVHYLPGTKVQRPPFGRDGAKRAAHQLARQGRQRSDWQAVNIRIMCDLVLHKFADHRDLRDKLLATEFAEIVEDNHWHDNFWGDCSCGNADGNHPECEYEGQNALGKILMAVRETLRQDPTVRAFDALEDARR